MKLNELKNKVDQMRLEHRAEERQLEESLRQDVAKEYNLEVLGHDWSNVLDTSKNYGSDEHGIYRWARITFPEIPEEYIPYAAAWLNEQFGYTVDVKNEAIMIYEGDCIVIDEESGDIVDESLDKRIANVNEFTNRFEMREFFNKYMNKAQYYPGVFTINRYGYVTLVNLK